jgi:universal stress protein E
MSNVNDPHPRSVRFADRAHCRDVFEKILVVVDPTAVRHPSVEKAARLAASCGSSLELYICDVDQSVPENWAGGTTLAQYRGVLREQRLAMLESLAAPIRARGVHVTVATEWFVPLEQGVVQHAIRSRADLVVKDTHRHAPALHMPVAQTDWIIIRHLPMPLLLVRPGEWPVRPLVSACVDPCHVAERPAQLDESLVDVSASVSRALAGEVSVLHSLQIPPHLPGDEPASKDVELAYEKQRAAVSSLAHRADLAGGALRFESGSFPESLIRLVKREKPDLLVMGVAARQRFQHGASSTASQVLEQTDCDLLVMKPTGFVSPALITNS